MGSRQDPRNFLQAPGVITLIRNTGGNLKVWDYLAIAKKAFPNIRMAQMRAPDFKKISQSCAGRDPVRLHPSLYKALKLIFPTDVCSIVKDGRVTTDIGTGSLGQSFGVLTPLDFRPVCVEGN